ncbi:MAG: GNAT family N-acetyltransferase [candidate division Zixibacteria bacterium]|nr:GNAT family N-acetyltransferase [candidate division Zixibacteria bacterium]
MTDKKKSFPAPPSLIGDKVFLRPSTPEDIANMHHWWLQSEPQSLSCRPHPFQTAKEAAERAQTAQKSADDQRFTVVRKDDKTTVALVRFFSLNPLNRSAELGLLVDPEVRRKGYGSEAIKIVTRYLFRYRGLNKVHAQTAAFNEGAIAMLESLGFKKDATLRNHYFYDGEFHVGYVYSLLQFEVDW